MIMTNNNTSNYSTPSAKGDNGTHRLGGEGEGRGVAARAHGAVALDVAAEFPPAAVLLRVRPPAVALWGKGCLG